MRYLILLVFSFSATAWIACDKEETGAPEIVFTAPIAGEVFNSGDTIRFSATVKDDDLRYIGWAVIIDSNSNVLTGFTDTLSLKNVVYSSKFVINTERFADYKIRITAGDKSGNINIANRAISVRP